MHPKQRLLALLLFALALVASLTRPAPLEAQLTLGSCYDAFWFDADAKRLEDRPKLDDAGFRRLASQFKPTDDPILQLCQTEGTKVLFAGNTTTTDQAKAFFAKYPCIDVVFIDDDANIGKTPAQLAAKRDALKAIMRPDQKTFATFSRSADPTQWANVCDVCHLQLYIYKEGTIRRWYWDYVLAWRAAHKGQIWIGPYLGKSVAPFFALYPKTGLPDPVWTADEYTPVAYNEAAVWCGLCAGADDVLFYTAYAIASNNPRTYHRIAERWDLLPGYKAALARIRSYERYFAGKRETFDRGRYVGASWTLPTGEKLTVTVDTLEALPRVDFLETKPTPPPTAQVKVTPAGVTITAPDGVEFATAP